MGRRNKRSALEKKLRTVRETLNLSLSEMILLSNSIFKKWKKNEDYHNYIVDYMFTVAYNHYKKHKSYMHTNKMLFLLKKFKNINTEKPELKAYYSMLTKKINRRVATKVYRERKERQEKVESFLIKLLEHNEEGVISLKLAEKICTYFTGHSLESFRETGKDYSLIEAVESILHEAKYAFPDKLPAINLLLVSTFSVKSTLLDSDINNLFAPVEEIVLL